MKVNANKKGFTLVELLAVIAIIGIVTLVAVGSINYYADQSIKGTMEIQEKELKDAANLYLLDYCKDPIDSDFLCMLDKSINNGVVNFNGSISLNQLVDVKYIEPITLNDVSCNAYVIVTNNEISPYIKCGDLYATEGYSESYE